MPKRTMYSQTLNWRPMSDFVASLNKNGFAPIIPDGAKEQRYRDLIDAYMACIYADMVYSFGEERLLRSAFESAFGRLRVLGVMTANDESNLIFKDYDEQLFMLVRLIDKAASPTKDSTNTDHE